MQNFMKRLVCALSLGLAIAAAGCAVAPPTNAATSPQVAVFAFEGTYEAALVVAVAYAQLPRCSATVAMPCSTQVVVDQIIRARNVARDSLQAAKVAVRTPGFGADVAKTAIVSAQAAVDALTALTVNLRLK